MFKVIGTELFYNGQLCGAIFDHDKITPTLRDDVISKLYTVDKQVLHIDCPNCGEELTIEE